jgi:large subunit ribosomal protein L35
LYTILIVNPDVPDLENDSFKTHLHWAVSNVPLSNVEHLVDVSKSNELVSYLPPHPEKNAPAHRLCVWVYRQAQQPGDVRRIDVDAADVVRDRFDIRAFSNKYGLDAVGAHLWRCKWDLSTPEVRKKYNLGEGNVYYKVRA